MATYTATLGELSLALAEALDFDAVRANGYETFRDLAEAVAKQLTAHEVDAANATRGRYRAIPEPTRYVLSDATRARAEAAGRELGQRRTDAYGKPCGPCAPAPSRSARMRALADSQPGR